MEKKFCDDEIPHTMKVWAEKHGFDSVIREGSLYKFSGRQEPMDMLISELKLSKWIYRALLWWYGIPMKGLEVKPYNGAGDTVVIKYNALKEK